MNLKGVRSGYELDAQAMSARTIDCMHSVSSHGGGMAYVATPVCALLPRLHMVSPVS